MQRNRIVALICLVVLITVSLSPNSTSAQEKLPRLAFESFSGNWDIYVWDRSTYVNVTNSPENELDPIWSSDGRLAYLSVNTPVDIYAMTITSDPYVNVWDGKTSTQIGQTGRYSTTLPTWSSDGKLAYVKIINEAARRVVVWNGTESIDVLPDAAYSNSPTWSSDGRLAFEATVDNNTDVYVWDGKSVTNVSEHSAIDNNPVWSADGKLAFGTYRDSNKREIYMWDGKAATNISQNPNTDYPFGMVWSADGKLAYTTESANGTRDVVVWDGKIAQHILEGVQTENPPLWSPDNRLLIIYRDEQGKEKVDLWDGKSLTSVAGAVGIRLIRNTFFGPDWSADSRLAIAVPINAGETEMGPVSISTIHIWDNGKLTPIEPLEPRPDLFAYVAADFAVWSSDNWLAWQGSQIRGDTMGDSKLFVWDGNKSVQVSPDAEASNQNPVWEPGG